MSGWIQSIPIRTSLDSLHIIYLIPPQNAPSNCEPDPTSRRRENNLKEALLQLVQKRYQIVHGELVTTLFCILSYIHIMALQSTASINWTHSDVGVYNYYLSSQYDNNLKPIYFSFKSDINKHILQSIFLMTFSSARNSPVLN